eukprot:3882627-Rhodomonas_salina.1
MPSASARAARRFRRRSTPGSDTTKRAERLGAPARQRLCEETSPDACGEEWGCELVLRGVASSFCVPISH